MYSNCTPKQLIEVNFMSYIALYREWRPSRFEDVVEQEHVVKTLRYSVSTGRIAHAYLFCGTRGTGKTTMAQILSRAVNCLNPKEGDPCNECEVCREILAGSCMDVLEIDAASNNSVDNVRAIRDEVIYAPTKARRKVYIIDEVHMLSSGAFNALLKTLEEPPAHVLFILATTEPHKLPATILSRCQRFDFRRITHESIIRHLDKIASASGTTLEPDAAKLIARMSEGAMRDAISLLDQCISTGGGRIGYEDVLSVAGIVNDVFMTDFIRCMLEKNVSAMLSNIERLIMDGRDIAQFVSDLVLYFRNLLICKATNGQCDNLIEVPAAVLETMKKQADRISQDEIVYRVKELSALEASLKWASNPRVLLEVTLIRLNSMAAADGSVAERLAALESRLNSGNFAANPAAQAAGQAAAQAPQGGGPAAWQQGAAAQYGAAGGPGPVQGMDGRGIPAAAAGAGASPTSATSSVAAGGGSKAAPAAQSDIVEFKQWPKIMDHLKSLGRMKIHSFLLTAKAVVLDDNDIGLLFGPRESFTRTLVSKMEHLEMIEEAIVKITGREMKVKCLDEESFQRAPSKPKAAEDDELVAKARKIAEKAGLPLEIIDE
jgi:DNA polymerase-3 subunit gamma/tau